MPRRFNCCVFNHPCPIWCPCVNLACRNDVVNPTFANDFAFFNNLNVGTIASQAQIPVSLVNSEGISILSNGAGAVSLLAGAYEVSYLANGTIPAGGILGIKLKLDGVDVSGSAISISQTAGDVVNLTQTMIITLLEASTLQLVNNTAENVDFNYASLSIRRI